MLLAKDHWLTMIDCGLWADLFAIRTLKLRESTETSLTNFQLWHGPTKKFHIDFMLFAKLVLSMIATKLIDNIKNRRYPPWATLSSSTVVIFAFL